MPAGGSGADSCRRQGAIAVASVRAVWHGGCFASAHEGRSMSIRPFTSESYSEDDRLEAWRDVLGAVGLQPRPLTTKYGEHATALPATLDGVGLMRIAAGSQAFSPLPRSRRDMPIVLMPIEDGVVLKTGDRPSDRAGRPSAAVAAPGRLERHLPARHARDRAVGDVGSVARPQDQRMPAFGDVQHHAAGRIRRCVRAHAGSGGARRSKRCPKPNGTRSRKASPICC